MADPEKKYKNIHYHNYLQLDKILQAQDLRSAALDEQLAHDERLFIVVHQVYELWFRQILHEIKLLIHLFESQ